MEEVTITYNIYVIQYENTQKVFKTKRDMELFLKDFNWNFHSQVVIARGPVSAEEYDKIF